MARTIKDAAICLGALTAVDSLDSKTLVPGRIAHKDYTQFLNPDGIRGKRIGYWETPLNGHFRMIDVMNEAVEFFESNGATIIELDQFVAQEASDHSYNVMLYEFKDGLNKYLKNLGIAAPVRDLEDLIDKTFSDSVEMRYHEHDIFLTAQSKGNLDSEDYRKSLEMMLHLSKEEGIDKIMEEYDLDAIIAPAGGPAWKTDLVNGDHFILGSSSPAAIAGYPNVVVPMGQIDGLPVGLSIFGRPWSEPILLEIGYSYEQGTNKRFTPKYIDAEL
jgi:amidase